jgi:hypothetical protein
MNCPPPSQRFVTGGRMIVELDGLAIPNTRILVSLALQDCPPLTAGVNVHRADTLRHYFYMGKRIGYALSPHLTGQAVFDETANQHLSELARGLLRATLRLPRGHLDRERTVQGIAALLLWLALHDRVHGQLLRETMLQSLQFSRMAVINIECQNRTYIASIGETTVRLNALATLFNENCD